MPSDQRGLFTIPSGQTRLRGIDYTWPAAHAAGFLKNDGSGNLSNAVLVFADLPTVPEASVYHNANQSISSITWTILAFNSERLDTDTIHDPSVNNSRLTCKTAGRYLVWAALVFAPNTNADRDVLLVKNSGGTPAGGTFLVDLAAAPSPGGAAVNGMNLMRIVPLAVNDYLEIHVYQGSAGAININASSEYSPEFGMRWLGA